MVFENENIAGFKDINPKAQVHILVVPKKHIPTVNNIEESDRGLMGDLIFSAREIAKEQKIAEGYKLIFNVGRRGGQVIDHIHLHLMGGW